MDVAAVALGIQSSSIWTISPPDRVRLLDDLKNSEPKKNLCVCYKLFNLYSHYIADEILTCRFRYVISRKTNSAQDIGIATDEQAYELGDGPKFNETRKRLINMLENIEVKQVDMLSLFPKFLKVKNNGVLKPIHQLTNDAECMF